MFSEGPAVSLNGSPTVSPTTAALWTSPPLPPRFPASIYFFALSHAPPLLAINTAIENPVTIEPTNNPPSASNPKAYPTIIGENIANNDGAIICFKADLVLIAMHFS